MSTPIQVAISNDLKRIDLRMDVICEHLCNIEKFKTKHDLILVHISYIEVAIGQLRNGIEHLQQDTIKAIEEGKPWNPQE